MPVLPILHHPDPRLRQKAKPVKDFDAKLQGLVDDLFETMYAAPGVGLAATQVGIPLRVAVVDCGKDTPGPMVLINPEILSREAQEEVEEGCLSVPDLSDRIKRFNKLRFRATGRDGAVFELDAEGLLSQCVQHEIDHLDGKLYIDHLSSLKRERINRRLRDQRESRGRSA